MQAPLADAFICWSNAIEKSNDQVQINSNWRTKFHLISILVVVISSITMLRLNAKNFNL